MKEPSSTLSRLWAKMARMKDENPDMSGDEILEALFLAAPQTSADGKALARGVVDWAELYEGGEE